MNLNYTCPKCGHKEYEVSEMRATGGFLTKLFDIQSKRFTTVICRQCRYTEFYAADSSMLGNIFDFFTQ
ncbi:MAG: zinc ribbon domain-containing protein [Candidatus Wallbacteria bacterium]|nr:zinc ribbon domain-containing protein [Candidatus Wallbacteria bacterium]